MKTETKFQKDRPNDLTGSLVLLAIGVVGVAILAAWFYSYW
jgi:hypothetical protein